jgi:hypothetical protein
MKLLRLRRNGGRQEAKLKRETIVINKSKFSTGNKHRDRPRGIEYWTGADERLVDILNCTV